MTCWWTRTQIRSCRKPVDNLISFPDLISLPFSHSSFFSWVTYNIEFLFMDLFCFLLSFVYNLPLTSRRIYYKKWELENECLISNNTGIVGRIQKSLFPIVSFSLESYPSFLHHLSFHCLCSSL